MQYGMKVTYSRTLLPRKLLCVIGVVALSLATTNADPTEDLKSFLRGETATWDSTGHPKAAGVQMKISYPKAWTSKEGNRPHIVQKFFGKFDDGMEQFLVQVRAFPESKTELNEEEKQILLDVIAEEMSNGGNLVSRVATKIDGEECEMLETKAVTERAGMKLGQKALNFVIPRKGAVVILQGSVGGNAANGFAEIEMRYATAKPLLQLIASSCVFTGKWLPNSD